MTKYSLTTWLCLIGVVPNVAQSGPLEDLQPGHWYEANSGLSDCSSATKPYLDCVTPGLGAGFGELVGQRLADLSDLLGDRGLQPREVRMAKGDRIGCGGGGARFHEPRRTLRGP